MKHFTPLVILLMMVCVPTFAESVSVSFRQSLELESVYGVSLGEKQKLELVYKPVLELNLPKQTKLTTIFRVRGNAFDNPESDLELRELYLSTDIGGTLVTVGKQQIVWGTADGLKVLDVVNPMEFREFLLEDFEDSRLPLWSIKAEIPIGNIVIQLLWVPDRTYHKLPDSSSIFSFTSRKYFIGSPAGLQMRQEPVKRPRRFFKDSDAGVRISTFWKGWDLTLNYLYHYDDYPVYYTSVQHNESGVQGVVAPRYERTHLFGATFSNSFGNLTVRGEVGYAANKYFAADDFDQPYADGVEKSAEFSYVLGFDWSGFTDTTISVQLFQDYLLDYSQRILREKVDTMASALVRREFMNNNLAVELVLIHSLNDGDGLIRSKVSYDMNDKTTYWLGVDLFYGQKDGVFGQFNRNDRLVLGVRYTI